MKKLSLSLPILMVLLVQACRPLGPVSPHLIYLTPSATPTFGMPVSSSTPFTATSTWTPNLIATYSPTTVPPTGSPTMTATFTPTRTHTVGWTLTSTSTRTPTGSTTPTRTSTLTPIPPITFSPTLTPTGSFSPTLTATCPCVISFTPTRTGTASPTCTNTGGSTRTSTSTSTPTLTATVTATLTGSVAATSTSTTTLTRTPTPTPGTGCAVLGTHDAAPSSYAPLPIDSYIANAYPAGSLCGQVFDRFEVYVSNASPSSASLELAVYDETVKVRQPSALVPASFTGWLTIPIPPVSFACGHSVILAAHGLSYGPSIGRAGSNSCQSTSGIYIGFMPATFPQPGILTLPATGACYEMDLACGTSSPTPTPTP